MAYCSEFGEIHYNNMLIDYSKIDKHAKLKLANSNFEKGINAKSEEIKTNYLKKALFDYYILNQIDPKNVNYIVQMGRIYDYLNNNPYAKAYFFKALQIDLKNASTNYYFGEYYYTRQDYTRALHYYNISFDNGYEENADVIIKLAKIYEKLGNLNFAKKYYIKAFLMDPQNEDVPDKIRELESVKYENTGYYKRKRNK